MGSVKFGKDTEMYLMFGDYYRLIQSIWEVETNDKYWQNVIQDMQIFKDKYKNEYAVDLVVALSNELTRKEKQLDKRDVGMMTERRVEKESELDSATKTKNETVKSAKIGGKQYVR